MNEKAERPLISARELARLHRPLTPAEKKRALAAIAELERLSAEDLARRGGVLWPSAADEIAEMRRERSEQLS